jgi:hypothetical protein
MLIELWLNWGLDKILSPIFEVDINTCYQICSYTVAVRLDKKQRWPQ